VHPDRIGRYRIVRLVGQGGMGVVYEGHDDRLDRPVAIKVVRAEVLADPAAYDRFRREARAAARVSHPNICALYEFDEENGQPFLVMELLAGETLAKRLERGALSWPELARLADQMLSALTALHQQGVIHRDLKPANIFLTPHGAKLVDFGLAQPAVVDDVTRIGLTGAGMLVGTPQYMSPERLAGEPADERADVWAAAAVLYEAAAASPAFPGRTLAEIIHAVGYDEPKPLEGTLALTLDRALRPAFAKDPARRTATVEVFARGIREATANAVGETISQPLGRGKDSGSAAKPATRFVALPLRVLRADPETDFLAFSVPDAVSAALSSLSGVVVRAPRALPAGADTDARKIGREWAVDVILSGTLMRAGSAVRVSAQLIDAADGTLRWSDTAQAPLEDLFRLQDELTSCIVSSLHLPLTGQDRRALERQAPANPEAYALFMRANQLMTESVHWEDARKLYEQAVELDPDYAPAWANLGRARRVLAKWGGSTGATLRAAQAAFARALALDPDLSAPYEQLAYVDIELGLAPETMARLLDRAADRPRDARLMAGLVAACRYAGLLDASVAAHAKAVAIDAEATTTVAWTHFDLGDYPSAIRTDVGTLPFCALLSRLVTGDIGPTEIKRVEDTMPPGSLQAGMRVYRLFAEGDVRQAIAELGQLVASGMRDPEAWFLGGTFMARAGAADEAIDWLTRSVDAGYGSYRALLERDHYDKLRGTAAFDRLVERARGRVEHARRLYERAGGPAILGPAR
jgi:TolB-like protein